MDPFKNILFDGKDIVIIASDARNSEAVVTFQPWSVKPFGTSLASRAIGFGAGAFMKRGVDELHVIARSNHWYQSSEMEIFLAVARSWLAGKPAVAYGASMGGYGALAFGSALGLQSIALAPQFTIDRTVAHFERRWVNEAAQIQSFDNSRIGRQTTGFVFYDPLVRLDRLQAELIFGASSCVAVRCPFAGHSVPRHVNKVMPLAELVIGVLRGSFSAPDFVERRRKLRLSEPTYLTTLYVSLKRDGREACAETVRGAAWAVAAKDIKDCARLFHQAIMSGNQDQAKELFELAQGLKTGAAPEYVQLASMAWRLGDAEACRATVAEGLKAAPGNQKLIELRGHWFDKSA